MAIGRGPSLPGTLWKLKLLRLSKGKKKSKEQLNREKYAGEAGWAIHTCRSSSHAVQCGQSLLI